MKRVLVPGGSGFLGTALARRLVGRGDEVVVLTRNRGQRHDGVAYVHWDGQSLGRWVEEIGRADAIVHLSGKRVDCLPTKSNVGKLISSRVGPVLTVGRALAASDERPATWVQVSSLAIFGEGGEKLIDEHSQPSGVGPPQMVQVCLAWESAVEKATELVDRVVVLRGGIGLGGDDDPATKRLLFLARWGLAGKIGSGQQWVSWVAIEDFINVVVRAIDDESMTGVYHVTSPNPVRNTEMMATYRRLAGRSWGLPSPRLVTRVGALILGSDPALALTGRRVFPTRLLEEGYEFDYPDFGEAAARSVAR